jgi:hypothetical protein
LQPEAKIKAMKVMGKALRQFTDECSADGRPLDDCPILAALERANRRQTQVYHDAPSRDSAAFAAAVFNFLSQPTLKVARIELVADAKTRRLLGAHILAPEGADSIQTAALHSARADGRRPR